MSKQLKRRLKRTTNQIHFCLRILSAMHQSPRHHNPIRVSSEIIANIKIFCRLIKATTPAQTLEVGAGEWGTGTLNIRRGY